MHARSRTARWGHAFGVALALVALALVAPALVAPAGMSAQGSDTLPLVRYAQGGTTTRYLPYGTPFRIRGSTNLPAGRADVVRVTFHEVTRSRDTVLGTSCWVRPLAPAPGPADTLFEVLAPSLRLQRRHRLELLFYSRMHLDDVDQLLQQAAGVMVRRLAESGDREFSADEVNPVWVEAVDERYRAMQLEQLSFDALGQCSVVHTDTARAAAMPRVHLTSAEANAVGEAVAARLEVDGRLALLQNAERELRAIGGAADALAPQLYAATHDPQRRGVPDSATIARVIDAMTERLPADLDDEEFARAFERVQAAAERRAFGLPAGEQEQLEDLVSALGKVAHRRAEHGRAGEAAEVAQDSVSRLHPRIDPGYWVGGTTRIAGQAWGDTTRVNALRLSIAYVTGAAYLGSDAISDASDGTPDGDADLDAASFVMVKYHVGPVDKSAPDPYSSWWARWSLTVGIKALSDLRFRGQKQAALFSSITPTAGVSYDLSRYLDFHTGLVFFRQPSVNPFNVNDRLSKARAALYLGVGFDTDPINRLGKLLTKG